MRILLAIDGSDDARKATRWLGALPLPAHTAIRVLAVATLPHSALDIPPVREFCDSIRLTCHKEAERAVATLAPRVAAEVRVADGDPREVIVREAADWRADLVVVGARGLGAVGRFLLGSVSTAVLHGAPGAVAVVHGHARPPRRVLIAYDGSPDALHAVRFVAGLPLGLDATVQLLGVAVPPPIPVVGPEIAMPWPPTMDRYVDEQKAELATALAQAESVLSNAVGRVERSIIVGQPAVEILGAAEKSGADLVVVGARGLGTLGRLVLGSVSERVVHHAACPVLVVRPKA